MSTIKELLEQKAALDAELESAFLEEQARVIQEIREKMVEYGITLAEILGDRKSAGGAAKKNVAPKYRDPDTGATWSGRGRAPHWIRDADDLSRFLIK